MNAHSTATQSLQDLPPAPAAVVTPAAVPGLVSRLAPPLLLPGSHFAVALGFLLLGAAGLVWVAPDLARGSFAQPRVVVVTHLFTLGWITTTILGALYQFLPVALQTPIRSSRVAGLTLALYAPGLLLFLVGLLRSTPSIMLPGAALFGTGLLIFVGNLALTLHRAADRNLTWWALAAAGVSLLSTIVLGVSLAGNLRWGYLGADRFLAVGVHMHVAIGGWVLLTVVGVAHRLLPMFLLSHGAPTLPGKAAAWLLASGVGLLLTVHHALTPWLIGAVGVLLWSGTAALIWQAILFFRSRRKPELDAGLRLAGSGLALLVVALLLGPGFAAMRMAAPRVATAYGATLLLAIALFVAGHYYKILPFLIWFHRFGPLVGKQSVPRVADLYGGGLARHAATTLTLGSAGLVISILIGSGGGTRAASVLFAIGAAILVAQMITISARRPV